MKTRIYAAPAVKGLNKPTEWCPGTHEPVAICGAMPRDTFQNGVGPLGHYVFSSVLDERAL